MTRIQTKYSKSNTFMAHDLKVTSSESKKKMIFMTAHLSEQHADIYGPFLII